MLCGRGSSLFHLSSDESLRWRERRGEGAGLVENKHLGGCERGGGTPLMLPSSEGPRVGNRQTSPPPDVFHCPRLHILLLRGGVFYIQSKAVEFIGLKMV